MHCIPKIQLPVERNNFTVLSLSCFLLILLIILAIIISQSTVTYLNNNFLQQNSYKSYKLNLNMDYKYKGTDVNIVLQLRAKEVKLDLDINILMPALVDATKQLEYRLRKEQQHYSSSVKNKIIPHNRNILIPINLTRIHHWVGIVIEFNKFNQAQRVIYLDSLYSGIPIHIERVLQKVYGKDVRIENTHGLFQVDSTSCGPLVVENLIRAAQRTNTVHIATKEEIQIIRKNHIALVDKYGPHLRLSYDKDFLPLFGHMVKGETKKMAEKHNLTSIMYGGGRKQKDKKGKQSKSPTASSSVSTVPIRPYLTAKQLRFLLKDRDLLNFTRRLYALLAGHRLILVSIAPIEQLNIQSISDISEQHQKLPVLIKQGETFNIYGFKDGKWQITVINEPNAVKYLMTLPFIDGKPSLINSRSSPELIENITEILKDGHTFSGRENQPRRLLDIFAELLVGDEICAAATFDGEHLFIATNRGNHEAPTISWNAGMRPVPGTYHQCLLCKPFLSIKLGDSTRVIESQEILYRPYLGIRVNQETLIPEATKTVLRPDVNQIVFNLPQNIREQLGFPKNSPDVSYRVHLTPELPLELGQTVVIPYDHPSHPQFEDMRTYVDPLKRRVAVIINHLNMVIRVYNHENKEGALRVIKNNRLRVFMQSLLWEAAHWHNYDLRNYIDPMSKIFREQFESFINLLLADFEKFVSENHVHNITSLVVRAWWETVTPKIENRKILAPDFIRSDIKRFMRFSRRYCRYFNNLEKLETAIIADAESKGVLSRLMSQKNSSETLPVIVGNEEDDLHAEIRLFLHFFLNGKQVPYIGVSQLCCCPCYLLMERMGVEVCGTHGKMFGEWLLAKQIIENEGILKRLFGDRLYEEYCNLKTGRVNLPEDKKSSPGITKAEAALRIFQSLGSLNKEDLERFKIGHERLQDLSEGFADDSDEENDFSSKVSDREKTKKVDGGEAKDFLSGELLTEFTELRPSIPSDGNCWVNAVLIAAQRIPGLVIPDTLNDITKLRNEIVNRLKSNRGQYEERVKNTIISLINQAIDENDGNIEGISEEFRKLLLPIIENARMHRILDRMFYEQIRLMEAQLRDAAPSQVSEEVSRNLSMLRERQAQLDAWWGSFLNEFIRERGYLAYCENLLMNGTWGGDLELGILSEILGVRIEVYNNTLSFNKRFRVRNTMHQQLYNYINRVNVFNETAGHVIHILHIGGNHYNVLLHLIEEVHIGNGVTHIPVEVEQNLTSIITIPNITNEKRLLILQQLQIEELLSQQLSEEIPHNTYYWGGPE